MEIVTASLPCINDATSGALTFPGPPTRLVEPGATWERVLWGRLSEGEYLGEGDPLK